MHPMLLTVLTGPRSGEKGRGEFEEETRLGGRERGSRRRVVMDLDRIGGASRWATFGARGERGRKKGSNDHAATDLSG